MQIVVALKQPSCLVSQMQSPASPYRSGRKYEVSELITIQLRASGLSLVLAHHR
jgi:hypothetical protein